MIQRFITVVLSLLVATTLILFARTAIHIDQWVSEKEHETISEYKERIILIAPELNTPYWRLLEQGARAKANEHQYLLQYMGPERHNPEQLERFFQKAISSAPDAIIIQGFAGAEQLVDQANQQNIPIMMVDTDSPTSNRLAYVGTDNILAAKQLAQLMIEHITTPAKVGVIMSDRQALNQVTRLNAFEEEISKYDDIEITNVQYSNISRLQAAEVTIDMLTSDPNINVIVGLSSLDAVGAVDGLSKLNIEDISVFGFDNISSTEAFISEQKIIGSIVQQPEEIGKQAIAVLHQYFEQKEYDERTFIPATLLTMEANDEN